MTWLQKKYYSMTCEQVETEVNGSSHGLTEGEARKRLKLFGPNVLEDDDISLGAIFIRQFNSPLVFILLAASAISLLLSEFVDFFVIIGLVTINALIGFWQEVKAATSLAELRKMTATKNMVVRGGKIRIIPSEEIVPGDCMVFHPGEVVTADVRLVDSSGIMANESTITGESMPIVKNHDVVLPEDSLPFEWTNMALTGSTIVRGTGRGIVVCTGRSTYLASIGAAIKEPSPITPLQAALQAFTKRYVILILGMLSFLGIVGAFQQRSPFELGYILLATLVSAVPEGLPIVVTLCMGQSFSEGSRPWFALCRPSKRSEARQSLLVIRQERLRKESCWCRMFFIPIFQHCSALPSCATTPGMESVIRSMLRSWNGLKMGRKFGKPVLKNGFCRLTRTGC